MPDCPPYGAEPTDKVKEYAGPFLKDNVGRITSWNFLDGKCTAHTKGYPYKAKSTGTPGESSIFFNNVNPDADLHTYEKTWIIFHGEKVRPTKWFVIRAMSSNILIVEDKHGFWPAAQLAPTADPEGNTINALRGYGWFYEDQVQRNISIDGDDTSAGEELDGFNYTYQLAEEDFSPIGTAGPLYKLLGETFEAASPTFYILIEGTAPSAFQAGIQPPEEPRALLTYHLASRFAIQAPITAANPNTTTTTTTEDEGTTTTTTTTEMAETSDCVGLECNDPFGHTGGAVISEESCDDSLNLYNPYAQNRSVNLYKQLNNIVSNIFGHTVNYFRTEANNRTKDVTLMEYSLFSVADQQDIKILVPDNEFPEESNTYNIFGMEWAEFEVHIVHDRFKAVFGDGIRPRAKDYLFIPIINKMYEVNSVSIADEFNASRSYWRLKLTKYQDRTSVIKTGYDIATDNLVTGIDELFGEEIADEQKKDTNPVQFQTISRILEDGSRTYIDSNLTITDEAIVNNFTTVSHNHYDLSKVAAGSTALRYATASNMIIDGQIAVTAWFRPTFEITDSGKYFLISDQIASGGFDIKINTLKIAVTIDGVDHEFTHNTSLSKDKWFGLVVNIMNNTEEVQLVLYSLSVSGHVSSLVQEYSETKSMIGGQSTWSGGSPYVLKGGKLNVTSLRIFDKAIGETEMANMLNQYVVHDNQHALVIDNAIPSLGYQKFKNAR